MGLRQVTRSIVGTIVIVAIAAIATACATPAAPQPTATSAAPKAAATSVASKPAATPAQPAATPAQPAAQTLVVYGDTVRGPAGLTDDEKPVLSCVQQNRFPQGSQVVWRFRVIDPATGKPMDDKQLKSLTLTLPDGKTQAFKYGPHTVNKEKQETDVFWTTSFQIPATYPTGTFNYKVQAVDNNGRTGSFTEFKVPAAVMQIVPAGKR